MKKLVLLGFATSVATFSLVAFSAETSHVQVADASQVPAGKCFSLNEKILLEGKNLRYDEMNLTAGRIPSKLIPDAALSRIETELDVQADENGNLEIGQVTLVSAAPSAPSGSLSVSNDTIRTKIDLKLSPVKDKDDHYNAVGTIELTETQQSLFPNKEVKICGVALDLVVTNGRVSRGNVIFHLKHGDKEGSVRIQALHLDRARKAPAGAQLAGSLNASGVPGSTNSKQAL